MNQLEEESFSLALFLCRNEAAEDSKGFVSLFYSQQCKQQDSGNFYSSNWGDEPGKRIRQLQNVPPHMSVLSKLLPKTIVGKL